MSPTLLRSLPGALVALLAVACTAPKDDAVDSGDTAPEVAGSAHCGLIDGDELWTAAASPHQVTCDLFIEGGVVTVEAGVVIEVQPGVMITVGEEGEASGLVVNGTLDAPVELREALAAEGSPGWGGLAIHPAGTGSSLRGLRVVRGGAELGAAVWADAAELFIDSVTIEDSVATGLRLVGGARLAEGSARLVVTGGAAEPVSVEADAAHTLPAEGSSYSGNAVDAVFMERREVIAEEVRWAALDVPWVITEQVDVEGLTAAPASLTVAPGARLLFMENAGLELAGSGGAARLFIGEPGGAAVTLGAWTEAVEPGLWEGVAANLGTLEVALHEVIFELGGQTGPEGAALRVQGEVEAVLDGVSISGSTGLGLFLQDGATLSADSGDLAISGCEGWPVRVSAEAAWSVPPSDYQGNASDGVLVDGGVITRAGTWEDLGVPYVVGGDLRVDGLPEAPALLTLEAGVTLLFEDGASLQLSPNGGQSGLHALGEEGREVVMTALRAEDEGFWDGLSAELGVPDGAFILRHVDMSWGGTSTFEALLKVVDAEVLVEDLRVANSRSLGFLLNGEGRFAEGSRGLTLDSNTDHGRVTGGAAHTLPAEVVFEGQTAPDGTSRGFHVIFISGTSDPVGRVTWAALPGGAWWLLNSIFLDGTAEDPTVLTLEPGAELWMGDNTALYVSGDAGAAGLIADASGGDPIRFLPAEAPVKGRWQGIKALTHCLDDEVVFKNVYVGYAGGAGDLLPDTSLLLDGCDALIEDTTVEHSDTSGVLIYGDPTLRDSTFSHNDDCGVRVASGDPTLSGLLYSNNGIGDACY